MTFPSVKEQGSSSEDRETTDHYIQIPSTTGTVNAGELLIAFICTDGNNTITNWGNGFTELFAMSNGNDVFLAIGYKIADGGESICSVITTNSERSSHVVYRVTGHDPSSAPSVSTGATGTTAYPDPDSLSISEATDCLWIAVEGNDDGRDYVWTYPTNYTYKQIYERVNHLAGQNIGVSARQYNASSENPGTYSLTNGLSLQVEQWVAVTVCVIPPPSTGTDHYYYPTDSMSLVDTSRSDVTSPKSDSMSMNDTLRQDVGMGISESFNYSDTPTLDITAHITDTLSIGDALQKDITGLVSDSMSIADSLKKGIGVNLTDSFGITDSLAKSITQIIVDTFTITDSIQSSQEYFRTYSDNMAISDSFMSSMAFLRQIADSLGITDSLRQDVVLRLTDIQIITDLLEFVAAYHRTFSDNLTITDDTAFVMTAIIVDIMTIADIINAIEGGSFLFPIKEIRDELKKYEKSHKIDWQKLGTIKDLQKIYKTHKIDEQKLQAIVSEVKRYIKHKIDEQKLKDKKDKNKKYKIDKIDEQKLKKGDD